VAETVDQPAGGPAAGSVSRRPGRPRTNHDARRAEIVDVAAHLFAQRGYHATSIGDLAEATGLQRGGLYHYIGSKENVLFDIHERFIEPLLEAAREIEARELPPDQTIRELAAALVHDIADYRDQVTVALHEWRTIVASEDRERVAKVRRARREFEEVVARAMQRGQAEGMFAFERTRLAVLGFLGMINYAYQWYRPDAPYEPDELAAAFSDFFIDGIRVR
jgi:AcrR family transcriptional regulator